MGAAVRAVALLFPGDATGGEPTAPASAEFVRDLLIEPAPYASLGLVVALADDDVLCDCSVRIAGPDLACLRFGRSMVSGVGGGVGAAAAGVGVQPPEASPGLAVFGDRSVFGQPGPCPVADTDRHDAGS